MYGSRVSTNLCDLLDIAASVCIMVAMSKEIGSVRNGNVGVVYSSTEVAALVGLSRSHVNRLADSGQFIGWYRKSPVIGSARVFPVASVEAFLEARKALN